MRGFSYVRTCSQPLPGSPPQGPSWAFSHSQDYLQSPLRSCEDFWSAALSQTSAPPTSRKEQTNLSPRDGREVRLPPFRLFLRARDNFVARTLRLWLYRPCFCSNSTLLCRDGLGVYAIDALDIARL